MLNWCPSSLTCKLELSEVYLSKVTPLVGMECTSKCSDVWMKIPLYQWKFHSQAPQLRYSFTLVAPPQSAAWVHGCLPPTTNHVETEASSYEEKLIQSIGELE